MRMKILRSLCNDRKKRAAIVCRAGSVQVQRKEHDPEESPVDPSGFHKMNILRNLSAMATALLVVTPILAAQESVSTQDPAALEKRMAQLRDRAEDLKNRQEWDAAGDVIREMAALDPQHPKVYLEV